MWDSFTHADGYLVTHPAVPRDGVVGDLTVARAAWAVLAYTGGWWAHKQGAAP